MVPLVQVKKPLPTPHSDPTSLWAHPHEHTPCSDLPTWLQAARPSINTLQALTPSGCGPHPSPPMNIPLLGSDGLSISYKRGVSGEGRLQASPGVPARLGSPAKDCVFTGGWGCLQSGREVRAWGVFTGVSPQPGGGCPWAAGRRQAIGSSAPPKAHGGLGAHASCQAPRFLLVLKTG